MIECLQGIKHKFSLKLACAKGLTFQQKPEQRNKVDNYIQSKSGVQCIIG